jgi:hypothetical protein
MQVVQIKTKKELEKSIAAILNSPNISEIGISKIVEEHLKRNPFVDQNLGKEFKTVAIYKNGDAQINLPFKGFCLEHFEYNLINS